MVLNLVNSRSGRAIMALRDNRIAAESVGISATKYQADGLCHLRRAGWSRRRLYAMNYSSIAAQEV